MGVAILLNRKLGGLYFARLDIFPDFPRKPEMRLEQNSCVRKIFLCQEKFAFDTPLFILLALFFAIFFVEQKRRRNVNGVSTSTQTTPSLKQAGSSKANI